MAAIALIFAGLSGLELLVWLPPFWRHRRPAGQVLWVVLGAASLCLLIAHPAVWTALLAWFSLYRVVNLQRLVNGRTQADYLYHGSLRTALWLIGLQALVLALAALTRGEHAAAAWLDALAAAQILTATALLVTTLRNLRSTVPPRLGRAHPSKDWPTLTVAIPARNETDDLEACLQSLVNNTYPKLEILVLDDCSQNKRTPEIIRGFAHAGVRFIAGSAPPEHWLAKNFAYRQLASEANGELLLFCGVDTRFEPDSLEAMVGTLLERRQTMLSFIPRNLAPGRWQLRPLLVQPGRYAWELALPRTSGQPPVLSTCWLITAEGLRAAGGFKAVSRASSPESFFARAASRPQRRYRLLQSTAQLPLASAKRFDEQQATAIRTRYPQLHRRPELVGLVSLAELALLIGPFALIITSLATHTWLPAALGLASSLMLLGVYGRIVALTYRRFLWRGLWLLPFAALYDIGLLNYSMWRYEFREVIWKGRNVCVPLMRVVPDLPKMTK